MWYRLWQEFYRCADLSQILEFLVLSSFQIFNINLKAFLHCIKEVLLIISDFIMTAEYCKLFTKWQFSFEYFSFCMHISACIHSKYICSVLTGGSATCLSISVPHNVFSLCLVCSSFICKIFLTHIFLYIFNII